jgi:hypothetical protein
MILEQSLVILYLPTNSELLVMTLVFDFINVPQVLRDSITSSNFHDKKKVKKALDKKFLHSNSTMKNQVSNESIRLYF